MPHAKNYLQTAILFATFATAFLNPTNICATPKKLVKEGDFTIAGLFPLHLYNAASDSYSYNLQAAVWAEAMIFAINEINDKKMLLGNKTFGYKIYDTCNMISTAQLCVLELFLGGDTKNERAETTQSKNPGHENSGNCSCRTFETSVVSVIGGASSKISSAVSTLLSVDRVPQISYSSTSTVLSVKKYHPSFLRTIPPDNFQAKFIVDVLKHYGWKYINLLASDDSYGRVGVDYFLPELANNGMCVALLTTFNSGANSRDIENIVQRLSGSEAANVTVLWCGRTSARAVIRAAAYVNLYGQTWIATEGWAGDEEILYHGANVVEGLFGVIPLMKFYQTFENYIVGKSIQDLKSYQLFYNAGNCNDSRNESSSLCLRSSPFQNSSGTLRIKIPNVIDAVYAVANGLARVLSENQTSYSHEKTPLHSMLLEAIKKLKFKGSTGINVHFNQNGDPNTAAYSLVNTRQTREGKLEFQIVGQWDSESRKITFSNKTKVSFARSSLSAPPSRCADECGPGYYALTETNKKCCWKCLKCPKDTYKDTNGNQKCKTCPKLSISNENKTTCLELEEKYLRFNSLHGIVIIALSAIGTLFSLGGMLVFMLFKDTPLVRSSNRELSLLQLAISTLSFLYPLLFLMKPNLLICYSKPLIFGVLFTVSNSIIFTKADRLLRIFKINYRVKRRSVTLMLSNKFQLMIVSSMAGLAVLISTMSFVFEPPALSHAINEESRSILIQCVNVTLPTNLLVGYTGMISLTSIFYTFKARNLPRQFREGRYIGLGMFVISLTWLFYLPVSSTTSLKELIEFPFCIAVFIANATILLVAYGPKTWRILVHPEENNVETFRSRLMTFTIQTSMVVKAVEKPVALKD